jgi:high affinity Mn2+ porin
VNCGSWFHPWSRLASILLLICVIDARSAPAKDSSDASLQVDTTGTLHHEAPERFALHSQATFVEQATAGFHAPYSGQNSLSGHIGRQTADATLYLGARLWSGSELWINPEVDQGFGLNNTVGVAGFPSGEAYKVGRSKPYFRLPRAFVRQTINLSGTREIVQSSANQLAQSRSTDRIIVTVGKFSVTDVFDTNQYAHDPRRDFLNWAAVDTGTFDYAADAWGYTAGAAAEWYQGSWALRGGLFDLSDVPNSAHLDPGFHEFEAVVELEKGHEVGGQPGRLRVTAFENRGRMGLLDAAVAFARESETPADIAAVRRYRSRMGASFVLEQQLVSDLGTFIRLGRAAGNVEAYEFTDIDRTLVLGLSLKGGHWTRAHDTVGLAAISNGISAARARFLDAGGLGILAGDGQLPPSGPERIVETYYDLAIFEWAHITLDYQWVEHPAYNRDRGPVSIAAVRIHIES